MKTPFTRYQFLTFVVFHWMLMPLALTCAEQPKSAANFDRENLVAWCIVPFDAKKRGPAERAEMLRRVGLRRVAYDWRAEHVPQFELEILQYKKHGIEYFAFWSWHDAMEPLIQKHGIKPQIWSVCRSPKGETLEEQTANAAQSLMPLVDKTKQLGIKLGIYNHGGWGGEPNNMVAVCKYLNDNHGADHVGIVYNFHHGHDHIDDFAESLRLMKPHLLCLNLNGMNDADAVRTNAAKNKIISIGAGKHEQRMIETVMKSGYTGPIGILDHRSDMDTEEVLRFNLQGLQSLLRH